MSAPTDPGRTCGTCTLCCKVMSIDVLGKPVGQWCVHCRIGGGCGIYVQRPDPCRAFHCLWVANPFPDAWAPALTGVVLDVDMDGHRLVARCDPDDPMAWRREPIYAALKGWAREHWPQGRQVVAVADRRTWLVTPTAHQPDIDLGQLDPTAPFTVGLRRDGRLEVKVHPPGTDPATIG